MAGAEILETQILKGRIAKALKQVGRENRSLLRDRVILKFPKELNSAQAYMKVDNILRFKSTDEKITEMIESVIPDVQAFLKEVEKEKELQSA